ncbi:MAG: 3-isopropylmalate dehydratase small subunit [Alcaligenaceae bacterium]|jgi:3-isopropylmalate/(R)-2-methylmalate dehydratase small subunit
MPGFTHLRAVAAPLEGRNIDTDQIIPARFLKKDRDALYKTYLFHDLRFDEDAKPRADFVLNKPAFKNAQILVTDENFGCGSSREAAVYCLSDFGIRAILAPSFGDIFFNNCLKNGLLPIKLEAETIERVRQALFSQVHTDSASCDISIDLASCTLQAPGLSETQTFTLDPFWQECLLKGVDELTLTLGYESEIKRFEQQHYGSRPWLSALK